MVYMHITMTQAIIIMRSTWREMTILNTCVKCNKIINSIMNQLFPGRSSSAEQPSMEHRRLVSIERLETVPHKAALSLQYASSWKLGLLTSTPMRQVQ